MLVLLVAIWLELRRQAKHFARLNIPGPRNSFFFGSFPALKALMDNNTRGKSSKSRLAAFQRLRERFGDVVKVKLMNNVYVLIYHVPSIRKHFLKSGKPASYERIAILFGDGLLVQNGARWKHSRKVLGEGFTNRSLRELVPWFKDAGSLLCAELKAKREVNFTEIIQKTTMDVISRAGFGFELNSMGGENMELVRALKNILPLLVHPLGQIGGKTATHFLKFLHRKDFAKIDEMLFKVINDRLEGRTCNKDGRRDLLDLLCEARSELTVQEIRDNALLFFVAGYDTSGLTLQWCMALLAKNPRVWNKLVREVDEVFQGRQVEFSDIKDLVYMEKVLLETLRLFPPVFAFTRVLSEDIEIEGCTIPAGEVCMFPVANLHRDPSVWSNPEGFDPDVNWSDEAKARRDEMNFFPFAFGERICIGQHFFWNESRILLAEICQTFSKLELLNDDVPEYTLATGTIHPIEDIRLRFT